MKKVLLFLSLILLTVFSGCSEKASNSNLTVAVSIPPQEAFVKAVCGDKADVITMIPAGASAESYEMSPKEITAFANSDIYFSIGVPAEEKGIIPHISKETKLVDLTYAVSSVYTDLKIGNEKDPHIWLSPKRAIVTVEEISNQMCELDPENAEFYRKNATDYTDKLNSINNEIANLFKDKRKKVFYISHPSYGYFASDFGLDMISLEKNGKEVTPKELAEITEIAKQNGVKIIFCQEETSKKQAELLAKEIGARVEILKPLSPDYCENLQKTADLIYEAVH